MKSALYLLVASTVISGVAAVAAQGPQPKVTLSRLDCGKIEGMDKNMFSDANAYPGQKIDLVASCYLIRHGDEYMLWDTGMAEGPGEGGAPPAVTRTIVQQLTQIGVAPDKIGRIGISHYHYDHTGQARNFPGATLMVGAGDWAVLSAETENPMAKQEPVRHWITEGGKVEAVQGDRDVFGDGTVRMIDLPGHTPGHHGLLVKLAGRGNVLLTGDQAHFTQNYASEGVPGFNTDRKDTLASFKRFKDLAKSLDATVVIQHEPADIAKLPPFPQAAE